MLVSIFTGHQKYYSCCCFLEVHDERVDERVGSQSDCCKSCGPFSLALGYLAVLCVGYVMGGMPTGGCTIWKLYGAESPTVHPSTCHYREVMVLV